MVPGGALCPFAASQPVEFGQHFPQVLGVLSPQICLLYFPSTAPRPAFGGGSVYHGVVVQKLVFCGDDKAPRADNTVRPDADGVMDARARRDGVEVTYGRGLDATADFKEVVVADAHDLFPPVYDYGAFLDDAARADDNRSGNSKDGRLGMDYRA